MKQPDFAQRQSRTQAVMAEFRAHPGEWISVHRLAHVGGFAAWRSRVAEGRKLFEAEGLTIEWNGIVLESAYRLRPMPQGRSSTTYRERLLPGFSGD